MNPMKTHSNRPVPPRRRARLPRHDCGNTGHTGTGPRKLFASNRWDGLIESSMQNLWPEMDWRLIKCQIRQESAFNPKAVSPCGAVGLMQIMPATGQSLGVSREMLFDPKENVRAGIIYLKQQYVRFPEIPDHSERVKFSLASYNGGRGYINRAIALARKEDAPWQTWDGVKPYLGSADCSVSGKHPDHRQIIAYVDRIWTDYARLSPSSTDKVQHSAHSIPISDRADGNTTPSLSGSRRRSACPTPAPGCVGENTPPPTISKDDGQISPLSTGDTHQRISPSSLGKVRQHISPPLTGGDQGEGDIPVISSSTRKGGTNP